MFCNAFLIDLTSFVSLESAEYFRDFISIVQFDNENKERCYWFAFL